MESETDLLHMCILESNLLQSRSSAKELMSSYDNAVLQVAPFHCWFTNSSHSLPSVRTRSSARRRSVPLFYLHYVFAHIDTDRLARLITQNPSELNLPKREPPATATGAGKAMTTILGELQSVAHMYIKRRVGWQPCR